MSNKVYKTVNTLHLKTTSCLIFHHPLPWYCYIATIAPASACSTSLYIAFPQFTSDLRLDKHSSLKRCLTNDDFRVAQPLAPGLSPYLGSSQLLLGFYEQLSMLSCMSITATLFTLSGPTSFNDARTRYSLLGCPCLSRFYAVTTVFL